ncbi:MAG: hypothetical protein M1541_14825 [Acidobacteria bacterium]|nr:hypothetical protein [Acidobacteriota bacterium]
MLKQSGRKTQSVVFAVSRKKSKNGITTTIQVHKIPGHVLVGLALLAATVWAVRGLLGNTIWDLLKLLLKS